MRSLLTSSHRRRGRSSDDNGLSSRDRNCQRRDGVVHHRQDAAACVSLSKSTMSKTRPEASGPAENARRREERRLYPPPISLSIDLLAPIGRVRFERKDRTRAARGEPLSVRSESIGGAEANANMTENQGPRASKSVRPPQKLRSAARGGVYGRPIGDASGFAGEFGRTPQASPGDI